MTTSSKSTTLSQYLSQRWIHENRYFLSRDTVPEQRKSLLNFKALRLLNLRYSDSVEVHLYDHEVPAEYDVPLRFFDGVHPWRVVMWVVDSGSVNANSLITIRKEKDDPYSPKSFYIEDVEAGWVAYNQIDNCIFVDHIQLHGSLKKQFTQSKERHLYKHMLREFVNLLPAGYHVFVPDATTLSLLSERIKGKTAITMPYTRRILQRCGFHRTDWNTFERLCSDAASQCIMRDHLSGEEIRLWHYETNHNITKSDVLLQLPL